jgi:hypothetical protein
MPNVTKLNTSKPRRLSETIYTVNGSRLVSPNEPKESRWFLPLLLAVALAAFLVVYFW